MMRQFTKLAALIVLLGLAACGKQPTQTEPTLHEVMAGSIDPVADVIWEESSKAYGEDGKAAPGKLTETEWRKIAMAGRDLYDGAMVIANDPDIVAVAPGVKILDEGTVPEAVAATQVAAYIERDRLGLALHARELSAIALAIEAGAKARDVVKVVKLSEDLDYVCEGCHQRFWYPDQPKQRAITAAP